MSNLESRMQVDYTFSRILLTASVSVAEVGEAPHVAQPDGIPDDRENKIQLPRPCLSLRLLRLQRDDLRETGRDVSQRDTTPSDVTTTLSDVRRYLATSDSTERRQATTSDIRRHRATSDSTERRQTVPSDIRRHQVTSDDTE